MRGASSVRGPRAGSSVWEIRAAGEDTEGSDGSGLALVLAGENGNDIKSIDASE